MLATALTALTVACTSSGRSDRSADECAETPTAVLVGLDEATLQRVLRATETGLLMARVETEGCRVDLTVLPDCPAPGRYTYQVDADETTLLIRRPAELPDALPAAGDEVRRSLGLYGGLKVQILQAGRLVAPEKLSIDPGLLRGGSCAMVTHVARRVDLGAFAISAVDAEQLERKEDLFKIVPQLGRKMVRKQGRRSDCRLADEQRARNPGCGVPVRAEFVALLRDQPAAKPIFVAGGRFMQGLPGDPDSGPPHIVDVDPFLLDATEVSVGEYNLCVRAGRCAPAGTGRMCNGARLERSSHPINCVTWAEAQAYCRFVGRRLPTEAEWERAARGDHRGPYPWGGSWPPPEKAVNLADASARRVHPEWLTDSTYRDGYPETSPVGALGPPGSGLRDIAGNVMEWTADFYAAYPPTPQLNPTGPNKGDARVVRGSSFGHATRVEFMLARRRAYRPGARSAHIGFRCASDVRN